MAFTKRFIIEVSSVGNPVEEKDIETAIKNIRMPHYRISTIDINKEYMQQHTYDYHKEGK